MKLCLIFFLMVGHLLAQPAPTVYVPWARVLRAQGYELSVAGDSFTTSSQVNKDGKKEDLPEGHGFGRIHSELRGLWGATHELQLGVGARWRKNTAQFKDGPEKLEGTSSGLQATFASLKYAFDPVDRMQYTLETTFSFTPYSNEEFDPAVDDPQSIVLGDSGNELSAGLAMSYLGPKQTFLSLRTGYRRPGADLSQEIYWALEGAWALRSVAFLAGVDGVSSLKNDPYENEPLERPVLNTQTELYGSVNREWISPYVGLNLALGSKWRVELRGSQTVSGNSTALGSTWGIGLIRRVEASASHLVDSRFKTYEIEANVTKVSPKKEHVVIDKGLGDDIQKGMRMDFFEFDYVGGNVLVASGVVIQTKSDSAIVKITQHFNQKKEIKEGLIGRANLK